MAQKKRILIIDNLAVESSRRDVYRGLEQWFEVNLLVPRVWKETTTATKCEPHSGLMDIYPVNILFGFRHHRVMYRGLHHVLKEVCPDFVLAVHAPENYATMQLLMSRKLLRSNMKMGLFASRNIDLPSVGFPYKLAFLNAFCDGMTARNKVDIVFHRPQSSAHLYKEYTERTVYIPHSVDCTSFKRKESEVAGIADRFVIGFVGRLVEEKGVQVLLEAVSRLPASVVVNITGEGPFRRRLEELTLRLGISERVIFRPLVPYRLMPQRIHEFDILVLPSLETKHWKELFGRILIEAMACEVPVVAADSGGIPEVVGGCGVLFKSGDAIDLAERISGLLENPTGREVLARQGRARALMMFDAPVVAEKMAREIFHVLEA